ncbi:MAG: hypothetical protein A4E65_03385 [Syntrophorhabdus sp. PtaU1.Bin153]|nr:MAG: hypothetical protein A4E65_03385 [Syntrophorhabdus sp. PtaU1.Bin153]
MVRQTLRITAPPAPNMIPIFLCFGERLRTAIAITTALSPARTRSMTIIIRNEEINCHEKSKYPKLPKCMCSPHMFGIVLIYIVHNASVPAVFQY